MTRKIIDLDKPLQTFSGIPARVASDKLSGPFSLLVVFTGPDGDEFYGLATRAGYKHCSGTPSDYDLMNVPDTRSEYRVFDEDGILDGFCTLEAAVNWATGFAICPHGVLEYTFDGDVTTSITLAHTFEEALA